MIKVTVDLTLGSMEDLIQPTIIEFTLNQDSNSGVSFVGFGNVPSMNLSSSLL